MKKIGIILIIQLFFIPSLALATCYDIVYDSITPSSTSAKIGSIIAINVRFHASSLCDVNKLQLVTSPNIIFTNNPGYYTNIDVSGPDGVTNYYFDITSNSPGTYSYYFDIDGTTSPSKSVEFTETAPTTIPITTSYVTTTPTTTLTTTTSSTTLTTTWQACPPSYVCNFFECQDENTPDILGKCYTYIKHPEYHCPAGSKCCERKDKECPECKYIVYDSITPSSTSAKIGSIIAIELRFHASSLCEANKIQLVTSPNIIFTNNQGLSYYTNKDVSGPDGVTTYYFDITSNSPGTYSYYFDIDGTTSPSKSVEFTETATTATTTIPITTSYVTTTPTTTATTTTSSSTLNLTLPMCPPNYVCDPFGCQDQNAPDILGKCYTFVKHPEYRCSAGLQCCERKEKVCPECKYECLLSVNDNNEPPNCYTYREHPETPCSFISKCYEKVSKVCPECTSDARCDYDKVCINEKCVKFPCECGKPVNHQCIPYECCENSNCPSDSVCDVSTHICKYKGVLEIIAFDISISQPLPDALVYINDEFKGLTNDDGIFKLSLLPSDYNVKIIARGYTEGDKIVAVNEKETTTTKIDISQLLEIRFEIPSEFEKYVYANQTAWTAIHPQEKRLMGFSFPIYSKNKVDVARDLITVVDKYIVYNTKNAWHNSDYEIIESHSGVCYDWAVLGTSFGDSYGIPSRYVQGCWKYKSRTGGEGESVCHAWQEVYLPEIGGWKHLDTLWDQFNNPCVYANQPTVDCIHGFITYEPDKYVYQQTKTYYCGKECSFEKSTENYNEPKNILAEQQTGFEYVYFVDIKDSKTANITFKVKLTNEESDEIRNFYKTNTLNETKIKETLLSIVLPEFETMGEISNIELTINNLDENNLPVWENLLFEITFPQDITEFKHNLILDQYSKLNYTLVTPLKVISISPSTDQRKIEPGENQYEWIFDKPGTFTINIGLEKENIGFVIPNEPIIDAITNSVASKTNSKVYKVDNNVLTEILNDNITTVYILGSYTDISSDIENNIKDKNIKTLRFTEEDYILVNEIATIFWQNSNEIVIGDLYDYDSIKKAENYSIQNGIPLLLIKEDKLPEIVKNTINQLSSKKIFISDPNNKISENVIIEISKLGKIENLSSKPKKPLISLNTILYGTIITVVICLTLILWTLYRRRKYKNS